MAFAAAAVLSILKKLDAAGSAAYCIMVEWINRDKTFLLFL